MISPVLSENLRCTSCNSQALRSVGSPIQKGIIFNEIFCDHCGVTYDVVDGVPFLGCYEEEDYIGLIEIIATSNQPNCISLDFARLLNETLRAYHLSGDKKAFSASHKEEMVRADWWPHRYHEWVQVEAVLGQLNLRDKTLLNIGAGTGTDAVRFCDAGAIVTCLDYSPMLTSIGQQVLPNATWIGGFSHLLPFGDEAFDFVCANAALHHMRSVPAALREMLRVLKPGGWLFTTGDPFRPDHSSDDFEFEVFNRHEAVLAGVNEGIVPFRQIYDTLSSFGDDVTVALLVDVASGPVLDGGTPIAGSGYNDQWVPLSRSNIDRLRECNGAIAVSVHKKTSIRGTVPVQRTPTLVSPGLLASWIRNDAQPYARLAAIAPDYLIDLPFPGRRQTWFDLLNGWMKPTLPFRTRQGVSRARWLLRVPNGRSELAFDVRCVAKGPRAFRVFINGMEQNVFEITNRWRSVRVAVADFAELGRMLVEMRIERDSEDNTIDGNSFQVRHRRFPTRSETIGLNFRRMFGFGLEGRSMH